MAADDPLGPDDPLLALHGDGSGATPGTGTISQNSLAASNPDAAMAIAAGLDAFSNPGKAISDAFNNPGAFTVNIPSIGLDQQTVDPTAAIAGKVIGQATKGVPGFGLAQTAAGFLGSMISHDVNAMNMNTDPELGPVNEAMLADHNFLAALAAGNMSGIPGFTGTIGGLQFDAAGRTISPRGPDAPPAGPSVRGGGDDPDTSNTSDGPTGPSGPGPGTSGNPSGEGPSTTGSTGVGPGPGNPDGAPGTPGDSGSSPGDE